MAVILTRYSLDLEHMFLMSSGGIKARASYGYTHREGSR